MPGKLHETKAILRWLAREVSRDSYVNIMGQYYPEYQVNAPDSKAKYADIKRRPFAEEIRGAYMAAREAGLWRFAEHG